MGLQVWLITSKQTEPDLNIKEKDFDQLLCSNLFVQQPIQVPWRTMVLLKYDGKQGSHFFTRKCYQVSSSVSL